MVKSPAEKQADYRERLQARQLEYFEELLSEVVTASDAIEAAYKKIAAARSKLLLEVIERKQKEQGSREE